MSYGPVTLPATFTNDHFGRIEVEENGHVTILRDGPRTVTLTFDNLSALHDYVTDARYYTDPGIAADMRESGCGNISRSAATALQRIKDAGLYELAFSKEAIELAAKYEKKQAERERAFRAEMKELFASRSN